MFKTTSKIEKTCETVCVSSFQESLFVCNPEQKLGHFDKIRPFSPLNAAFNT